MRILVTNDDGINAPGLVVVEKIAHQLAGPDGEVWVVAPAFEQSGVAHCVSYARPTMLAQLSKRRFVAEGTPADCVMAGIHEIMCDALPDLVISGVNHGNNAGENALYSGTLGGAMEAALQGIPAVALSQFHKGQSAHHIGTEKDPFDSSAGHAVDLLRLMLEKAPWGGQEYHLFYNINFPPIPASQVKGYRVTAQGRRLESGFGIESQISPSGHKFLWVRVGNQAVPTGPGTDVSANLDGYISITPMRADLTDHTVLQDIRDILE